MYKAMSAQNTNTLAREGTRWTEDEVSSELLLLLGIDADPASQKDELWHRKIERNQTHDKIGIALRRSNRACRIQLHHLRKVKARQAQQAQPPQPQSAAVPQQPLPAPFPSPLLSNVADSQATLSDDDTEMPEARDESPNEPQEEAQDESQQQAAAAPAGTWTAQLVDLPQQNPGPQSSGHQVLQPPAPAAAGPSGATPVLPQLSGSQPLQPPAPAAAGSSGAAPVLPQLSGSQPLQPPAPAATSPSGAATGLPQISGDQLPQTPVLAATGPAGEVFVLPGQRIVGPWRSLNYHEQATTPPVVGSPTSRWQALQDAAHMSPYLLVSRIRPQQEIREMMDVGSILNQASESSSVWSV